MKKVVGGLAVSLVLLVGATACGGGDDAESGTSPTTAEAGAPSTTAAAGGSAASGGSSSNSGAKALCDKVDELIASVEAKDAARTDAAQDAVREEMDKAKEVVQSDPMKAGDYNECIQKGAQALSGKVGDL
jgi:hypothetical protein